MQTEINSPAINLPTEFFIPKYNPPKFAEKREKDKRLVVEGKAEKKTRTPLTVEQQMERVADCGKWVTEMGSNGQWVRHQHQCNYIKHCKSCRTKSQDSLVEDYLEAINDIGGQLWVYGIALPIDEWNKIRVRLKKAGLMYAKVNVNDNEYHLAVASVGEPDVYKMTDWIDTKIAQWRVSKDGEFWRDILTYSDYGKKSGELINYRKNKQAKIDAKRVSQIAETAYFDIPNDKCEQAKIAFDKAVDDTRHYVWYANENLDGRAKAIIARSQAFMKRMHEMKVPFVVHWKEIRIFDDELGDFK